MIFNNSCTITLIIINPVLTEPTKLRKTKITELDQVRIID